MMNRWQRNVNLQNVPAHNHLVKRGFIPKLDVFMFIDYKAIEVRLLAHYLDLIGDGTLRREFEQNVDPHKVTAQGLYPGKTITEEMRNTGKTLNFSMIYGGGTATIMKQLGVNQTEARRLLKAFHNTRPGDKTLQNIITDTVEWRGYIKNAYGRRYWIEPDFAYKGLNYLIQGTAADMMKRATVKVHNYLGSLQMDTHIVNIIHDELMFDCNIYELQMRLQEDIANIMCTQLKTKVPIQVDVEYGKTWGDKTEVLPC
jgi:DNA polymerase-1